MRVCVISDTHLDGDFSLIPGRSVSVIQDADLVIHCGDVYTKAALNYLHNLNKNFVAVQGDWDTEGLPRLPFSEFLNIDGVNVGITHGHLGNERAGTIMKAYNLFKGENADLIFVGHSHAQVDRVVGGVRVVNPGSLVEKRLSKGRSLVVMDIEKAEYSIRFLYF